MILCGGDWTPIPQCSHWGLPPDGEARAEDRCAVVSYADAIKIPGGASPSPTGRRGLCVAEICLAFPGRWCARLFQCLALPRSALPFRCCGGRFRAMPVHGRERRCQSADARYHAVPVQNVPMLCSSYTVWHTAGPRRCNANALLFTAITEPGPCPAGRFTSFPLGGYANPFLNKATLRRCGADRCNSNAKQNSTTQRR